jgi:hypothetical protein
MIDIQVNYFQLVVSLYHSYLLTLYIFRVPKMPILEKKNIVENQKKN